MNYVVHTNVNGGSYGPWGGVKHFQMFTCIFILANIKPLNNHILFPIVKTNQGSVIYE